MVLGGNCPTTLGRLRGGSQCWVCFPVLVLWNCATSRGRENRATSGLAQPVPATTSTNGGESSSVVDGVRRSNEGVAVKNHRIEWSKALEMDLTRCNEAIPLSVGQGRRKELIRLWHKLHPKLPALGAALAQCLSRILKSGKGNVLAPLPAESVPSPGLETAEICGETPVEPRQTRTRGGTEEEALFDHEPSPSEVPHRRPGRPWMSPVLETSGSATDSDNEDAGTELGALNIRCENHSISDELRNEFLSVLRTVSSCEKGDFSGRARPSYKIVVPKKLVKAMDELIAEEFLKGSQSHWSLNCLVYTGAELISRWVRRTFAEKTRNQSGQKWKEAQVLQFRRKLGWLEAEIRRQKSEKQATPRQWNNSRQLRMEHCSLRELEVSLEMKKACLRVRATQLRRQHVLLPLTLLIVGREFPVYDHVGPGMTRRASNTCQQTRFLSSGRA